MKDAETDYISASKDTYISLLITFVFMEIMKILYKLLGNLFRALAIQKCSRNSADRCLIGSRETIKWIILVNNES